MARKPTGAVVEHPGRDGHTYRSLRFTAYGKRRFVSLGPVEPEVAERKLRLALDQVAEGTWKPAQAVEPPPESEPVPTFHAFAESWWLRNERRFAAKTVEDYRWRLEQHLLPYFAERRLDRITFDTVEEYIAAKLAEPEPLSARSINMTLLLLAAILETAVERDLIPRNPAKGKARRVPERAPRRSYLDTAEHIRALLDAAAELDREARSSASGWRAGAPHVERRAILATLTFAGLRIGELSALRWRDVDLAAGWLHVGEAKTDAGRRRVKLRGALRDELASVKARTKHGEPDDPVFVTSSGRAMAATNIRLRVLARSVKLANERLIARGFAPLPERLTPHSLRRTFASVLYALGEDPGIVMDEMGHTNPGLALRIYRQAMRRDEGQKAALRSLVEGLESAVIGIRPDLAPSPVAERDAASA